MKRATYICDLIKTYDPIGMADLTPHECTGSKWLIVRDLIDYYITGELTEPDDPEFIELINNIKIYRDDIYGEEPEMTDHLYVICHGIEGGVYESLLNAQSKDEAIAAIKKYANSLTDDEIKQTTWLDLVYAEITEDGLPDYQNSETIYTVIREE